MQNIIFNYLKNQKLPHGPSTAVGTLIRTIYIALCIFSALILTPHSDAGPGPDRPADWLTHSVRIGASIALRFVKS